MIKMIWAMDRDFLIGDQNRMPWHYKEDLLFFKQQTKDRTVLMGENTYYSLLSYYKDKPFPYGKIYLATLNNLNIENVTIVDDIKSFLSSYSKEEDIYIIGGKTIYQLALPYADELIVTLIDKSHHGDTYFFIDFTPFNLIKKEDKGILSFRVYQRKK